MTKSRMVRVLLALGAAVLASATLAMASGGLPKVPSYSGPYSKGDLQVRPASIVYTAHDRGFFAGRQKGHGYARLNWSSWTSGSAEGSGFNWVNVCQPGCRTSSLRANPVQLKLWRPRKVSGHLVFTRLTMTVLAKRPPHRSRGFQVWKLGHHGKVWFWVFPHHH